MNACSYRSSDRYLQVHWQLDTLQSCSGRHTGRLSESLSSNNELKKVRTAIVHIAGML